MFKLSELSGESHMNILYAIADGLAIANLEGILVEVNPAFSEMYGYSRDEAVGMNVLSIISPPYHPVFANFAKQLATTGKFHGETIDVRKDGTSMNVEIRGRLVELDGEKYLLAILSDVSEKKRMLSELVNSNHRFSDLYDNAPDMYVSVDARTSLVMQCNQTLLDKTGFTREEVLGRPVFERYHPDSMADAKSAFEYFCETGHIRDKELALIRKDGVKIEVSLNVTSTRDDEGNVLESRSAWRDIADMKIARMKLQSKTDKLKAALAEIKQLSGMLPICASCKMIRDDHGSWHPVESYIKERSEADFSHSICPECSRSLYPDLMARK